MFPSETKKQQAFLVAVDTGAYSAEDSLQELEELAETAGAEVLGTTIQKREAIHTATYVGQGKLQEIQDFCQSFEVDLLIFDDELTGSQMKNIEAATGVSVIDRTMLILDIFAQRAKSREGKLQVKLAQQKYLLPRLSGVGKFLSRQGGGIGTRGPGETKLESDRRHIRSEMQRLTEQLRLLQERRSRVRQHRKKREVPVVAIVGYTNAGKSTMLKGLTGAETWIQDQLFATLDPLAREAILPNGKKVIFVDTVGFIRRLPHHLVEAFHSTLEEAVEADLLLLVCDASDPQVAEQKECAQNLLREIGAHQPMLTVYNKVDKLPERLGTDTEHTLFLSALCEEDMQTLKQKVEDKLFQGRKRVQLLLPYSESRWLDLLFQEGCVLAQSCEVEGIAVEALLGEKHYAQLRSYIIG